MANNKLPLELDFSIGGYSGPSYSVFWDGSCLTITPHRPSYLMPSEEVQPDPTTVPTPRKWQNFWKKVDAAGVWNWDQRYDNPNILDGTHWSLTMRIDDRSIESSGSNEYPPTFDDFLRAIQILTGRKDIH